MMDHKNELLKQLIVEGSTYQSLYENHPDAICVLDVNGYYIKANPAAQRLTGYTLERFRDTPAHRLFNNNGDTLRSYYLNKALQGETNSFELNFTRLDGQILDLDVTYVPITAEGEVVGVHSIFKDVTLTKEMQRRLMESDKLYQVLTNDAKDVIAFATLTGICLSISPAIHNVIGYTPEELVGTQLKELFADKGTWENKDLIASTGILTGRLRHANGSEVWVEASIQKVQDSGTQADKLLIIARNITPRMQAEMHLRRSEQSLTRAQKIAHIGSWEWDVQQQRFTCSNEFTRIYEQDFSQFSSPFEEWLKVIHPDDKLMITEALEAVSSKAVQSFELEFRVIGIGDKDKVLFSQTDIELDETGRIRRMFGIVQDITDRNQMERRLRESEKQYRLISENSLDLISKHKSDEKSTYSYASPACITLLGYQPEELVGTSAFDYFHPEDVKVVQDYLSVQLQFHSEYTVTYRIRRKDGVYIWFESTGRYTFDDMTGEILEVVAVSRDVTERKNGERSLQESQQRYKSLFEYSPSAVYSLDLKGNYVTLNSNLEVLSGYSKEELLGMNFSQIISSSELSKTVNYFQLSMKGKPQSYETTILHKDGTPVELNVTNVPIIVDQHIVGVYGIATDITERKRYIEQIEKLSYQHSLILNSVSEGIYGLDEEGKTIFVNPAASQMLGYDIAEFIGTDNHQLIHHSRSDGSPYPVDECLIHQTFRDGRPRTVNEEVFWRKDGSSFLVNYRATPLYDREQIVGVVVVFNDITNEREIVRAKESAERATRAKSEFLAMMSHEIRTPLNGIIGMTDLLLETQLQEEQREYADIISDSGRALLGILNDVLDFSKVEAGKMALDYDWFDLSASLTSVIDLFTPAAMEKNISLTWWIDPAIPRTIRSDSSRLRQILINLVSNALKFTDTGSITISVHRIPAVAGPSLLLEFRISDTGIGIAEDKIDRLFQTFSQLHPVINRKYGGTGLGLAICKRMVELMGGSISAESQEGVGSTFSFTLISHDEELTLQEKACEGDLAKIVPSDGEPESEDWLQFKELKVLIAEDHPVNGQIFVQMLGRIGITADVAHNGVEVVEEVSRKRYDMIFMDIKMPVMDGIKAARIIRQVVPQGDKPIIIALAAQADYDDIQLGLTSGIEDYIRKPFKLQDIKAKLIEWSSALEERRR
ncbi:PAS domain S-box protein [Paenibacillus zeisoli]|uniref:Circadian input-output histidine kinase CikA n=1 Tax=Paenibacillus zeisoli TaxID=2496267 RepID=A0A433X626_9BACL|nr:PAS domain S-box protein [Paenibacillus zeisoli]RUT29492.1 PAS domain S-box protein [Paenibacillus zeisoli]